MINKKNHNIALEAALRSGEDLRVLNPRNNNSNNNINRNNKTSAKKQQTIAKNRTKAKHFQSRK